MFLKCSSSIANLPKSVIAPVVRVWLLYHRGEGSVWRPSWLWMSEGKPNHPAANTRARVRRALQHVEEESKSKSVTPEPPGLSARPQEGSWVVCVCVASAPWLRFTVQDVRKSQPLCSR